LCELRGCVNCFARFGVLFSLTVAVCRHQTLTSMLQNLEATLYTITQGSIYDLSDKRQILQLSLVVETLIVFCFSITSFLVSSTANAGFNVVLNAFLNVGYVGGSYYALKAKAPIAIGFLMGVTLMMAVLDLMTAVYWGQLSHCEKLPNEAIDQYSCHNRTTYKAVSVFASILFIIKTLFLGAVAYWQQDLVDETCVYADVLQDSAGGGDGGGGVVFGRSNHDSSARNHNINSKTHVTSECPPFSCDEDEGEEESFSI
jgi:hypothetical protein